MLKKAISWLLVFCLMLHCSARLGIVAYFYSNQSYIADVLCINKEKVALQCNGSCFLSKKLKSHNDANKQLPSSLQTVQETVLFYQEPATKNARTYLESIVNKFPLFLLKLYNTPHFKIELPPKLIIDPAY